VREGVENVPVLIAQKRLKCDGGSVSFKVKQPWPWLGKSLGRFMEKRIEEKEDEYTTHKTYVQKLTTLGWQEKSISWSWPTLADESVF